MAVNRDIKYINKDFNEFRSQLLNFAQTYFPTTYTDFTPSSPGVMFMEMASYVGDVLSFYIDNQIQENFLQYARQSNNLYELAYMFGYKPKVTGLATVDIDFYQLVPAKTVGPDIVPDYDYALYVNANTQVSSRTSTTRFIIEDPIDFTISSSLDPTTVSVAQVAGGNPTYYLLKKTRKSTSGTINSINFSFGSPVEFATVSINGANIRLSSQVLQPQEHDFSFKLYPWRDSLMKEGEEFYEKQIEVLPELYKDVCSGVKV